MFNRFASIATIPTPALTPGPPAAWFPLDRPRASGGTGDVADLMGGTAPGVRSGGCTFGPGLLALDGSGSVRIPWPASLKTPVLSWSARVNPAVVANNGKICSLAYRADPSWAPPYLCFGLQSSDGMTGHPAALVSVAGTLYVATSTVALPLGRWTCLAATYDGSTLSLYQDGALTATAATGGGPIDYGSSGDLTVGQDSYSSPAGEFFVGSLSSLTVYPRVLSPDEIHRDTDPDWRRRVPSLVWLYAATAPVVITISPATIPSGESFGAASLAGSATISPATIASGESFGTVVLTAAATISPATIASGESFGAIVLTAIAPPYTGPVPSPYAAIVQHDTAHPDPWKAKVEAD